MHAAPQDLPCLAELGLRPARLFDTELAGRLLGDERVALGTMVEQWLRCASGEGAFGGRLEHSPTPREWLAYAALDVELLIPLHEVLARQLADAGKVEWAAEEFEAIRAAPPAAPRDDPWRRTSGLHAIRTRRELAIVRSLWYARDAWAAERDVAPGRLLPDSAIIAAARANPSGPAELTQLPTFRGPRQRRAIWPLVECGCRGLGAARRRSAPAGQPYRRDAANQSLAGTGSTGGRAACRLPSRRLDARSTAPGTPAEPAGRRHRAQALVGTSGSPGRDRRAHHVGKTWRATLADRAHGCSRLSDALTKARAADPTA